MTHPDEAKRPTAEEVLRHPFITGEQSNPQPADIVRRGLKAALVRAWVVLERSDNLSEKVKKLPAFRIAEKGKNESEKYGRNRMHNNAVDYDHKSLANKISRIVHTVSTPGSTDSIIEEKGLAQKRTATSRFEIESRKDIKCDQTDKKVKSTAFPHLSIERRPHKKFTEFSLGTPQTKDNENSLIALLEKTKSRQERVVKAFPIKKESDQKDRNFNNTVIAGGRNILGREIFDFSVSNYKDVQSDLYSKNTAVKFNRANQMVRNSLPLLNSRKVIL